MAFTATLKAMKTVIATVTPTRHAAARHGLRPSRVMNCSRVDVDISIFVEHLFANLKQIRKSDSPKLRMCIDPLIILRIE